MTQKDATLNWRIAGENAQHAVLGKLPILVMGMVVLAFLAAALITTVPGIASPASPTHVAHTSTGAQDSLAPAYPSLLAVRPDTRFLARNPELNMALRHAASLLAGRAAFEAANPEIGVARRHIAATAAAREASFLAKNPEVQAMLRYVPAIAQPLPVPPRSIHTHAQFVSLNPEVRVYEQHVAGTAMAEVVAAREFLARNPEVRAFLRHRASMRGPETLLPSAAELQALYRYLADTKAMAASAFLARNPEAHFASRYGTESVSIDSNPELRAFARHMVATLAQAQAQFLLENPEVGRLLRHAAQGTGQ